MGLELCVRLQRGPMVCMRLVLYIVCGVVCAPVLTSSVLWCGRLFLSQGWQLCCAGAAKRRVQGSVGDDQGSTGHVQETGRSDVLAYTRTHTGMHRHTHARAHAHTHVTSQTLTYMYQCGGSDVLAYTRTYTGCTLNAQDMSTHTTTYEHTDVRG